MALRGPAAGHSLVRTSADPAGLTVLGMLNNCAGGVTPWGTFLTGEENIWLYFDGKPEDLADEALRALHRRYGLGAARYGWGRHHGRFDLRREPHEPNRFGWVVEIDPYDPSSVPVKHTALGRMAHEGATVAIAKSGRPVVYMGDDARFEYLYKFVADGRYDAGDRTAAMRLLDSGTLYAARFRDDGTGEWLPLVFGSGPLTEAGGFRSQAEIVINARRAADLLGATKMDRPEDVEPSPVTGKVYAVMTGNERRTPAQLDRANPRAGVKYGHIIELIEDAGDHAATRFRWEMFILAGDPRKPEHRAAYQGRMDVSPFAMPDNLAFDDLGRMWSPPTAWTDPGAQRRPVGGRYRGARPRPRPPVPLGPGRRRDLRPRLHARRPDLVRGRPAPRARRQGHLPNAGQPLPGLPAGAAAPAKRGGDLSRWAERRDALRLRETLRPGP